MASRVRRWARENVSMDLCIDAVNDARESLWNAATLATLSKFTQSPVQLTLPVNSTEFTFVTIPDPKIFPDVGQTNGGMLPDREYTVSFTYVVDDGSETQESLAITIHVDANTLLLVQPPPFIEAAVGYNVYAGIAGRRILQTPNPLRFNVSFIELPLGVGAAPGGVNPPVQNTTGNNIVALKRFDVLNTDGQTWTKWLQTSVNSTAFTQFQNSYPTTCTWQQYCYDFIDNRKMEIRPSTGTELTAQAFYVLRPARLCFPDSRIGFTSIAGAQSFIGQRALSDVLASLYEDDASDRWATRAAATKQEILLSIVNESWDQNTTVRAYNPNGMNRQSGVVS